MTYVQYDSDWFCLDQLIHSKDQKDSKELLVLESDISNEQ